MQVYTKAEALSIGCSEIKIGKHFVVKWNTDMRNITNRNISRKKRSNNTITRAVNNNEV